MPSTAGNVQSVSSMQDADSHTQVGVYDPKNPRFACSGVLHLQSGQRVVIEKEERRKQIFIVCAVEDPVRAKHPIFQHADQRSRAG